MYCTVLYCTDALLHCDEYIHTQDDQGNILGILTPADVMMDLVHVVRNLPPAPEEREIEVNAEAMP